MQKCRIANDSEHSLGKVSKKATARMVRKIIACNTIFLCKFLYFIALPRGSVQG